MEMIYKMTFENYQGKNFIEYYHHKKDAIEKFIQLYQKNRNKKEFEGYFQYWVFYYFDPDYNEYKTRVELEPIPYTHEYDYEN